MEHCFVSGAQMILSMKIISVAFDYGSGAIIDLPNMAEYVGYCFHVGTVIFGPWISYQDYFRGLLTDILPLVSLTTLLSDKDALKGIIYNSYDPVKKGGWVKLGFLKCVLLSSYILQNFCNLLEELGKIILTHSVAASDSYITMLGPVCNCYCHSTFVNQYINAKAINCAINYQCSMS